MRKDDWISGMYHGYDGYLYKMIQLKPILEQVRGASQVAGTEDDDRTIIPQEDITKELSKVGTTDFRVTTIKGSYALTLERKFEDYKQTLKFVNDVAKISEKLDHPLVLSELVN